MNRIALALCLVAVGASASADEPTSVAATTYYRTFSHAHPVLKRIKPGEAVATKTVDSAGLDEKDVKQSEPFNPLTGPFFVEGAEPGDALVVTLKKVRLNRDWGWSAYRLGLFSLTPETVEHIYPNDIHPDLVIKGRATLVPWDFDRKANTVRLRTPKSSVHDLVFPAKPMLGCIGVAAPAGDFSPDRLGTVGALRWQPRLQQNRRRRDGVSAGLSSRWIAVRGRWPCPPGRWRADRHGYRDVDGCGIRRRAEEGGDTERAEGRDGRRDHQHRLAARVCQRPRQWPQNGYKRTWPAGSPRTTAWSPGPPTC